MKKIFIIICCLATLHSYSQSKKIVAIEQKRYELMEKGDTAALSLMLAPSLQYYHSNGMLDTKQSLLNSIGTRELVHKKITITEQTVRVYRRKFALVTGKCIYDINYKGVDMVLQFVFTNAYYKYKGKWLLITRQTTKIA